MTRNELPANIGLIFCPTNSRAGLSFTETVFAVLLLGLILGPILMSVSTLNRATSASVYEMMASHLTSEILEQVRVWPIATVLEANGASSLSAIKSTLVIPVDNSELQRIEFCKGLSILASPVPKEIFKSRTVTFGSETRTAGGMKVNLARVTVTVTWQAPGAAKEKNFTAMTHIMEP